MTGPATHPGLPERLSEVVRGGKCRGCGVCAGVAQCGSLEMRLTEEGVFAPVAAECVECGVCTSVCPGVNEQRVDEGGTLGAYLETLVGYSALDAERWNASSGGLATRVLKAMLARKDVEAVVAATLGAGGETLFEARVLRTPEAVDRATGSKYYPVEFSGALRELRESGETFALVGLPCVITALALGRERRGWLHDQCRHLIGLTCGHLVSTHYTSFLATVTNVTPNDLLTTDYRRKPGPRGAGDFKFVAERTDGTTGDELPFSSGRGIPTTLWGARLFTPEACFRCTDLFAVNADLTLMDAWLRDYREDRAGTSLVIVRSEYMRDLLEDERTAGRLCLEPIAPEQVIASQPAALASRRKAMALRKAEAGEVRLPLKERTSLWWERRRAKLSNRLLAGGPASRAAGVRTIRVWLTVHRTKRRLRSLTSRLLRALKTHLFR